MEVTAAGVSRETENRLRGSETQTTTDGNAYIAIQAESKLGQIRQSPGKENQRKELGFPLISLSESSLFSALC